MKEKVLNTSKNYELSTIFQVLDKIIIALGTVFIIGIALVFISGLEIIQIPIILTSVISIFGLLVNYYVKSERDAISKLKTTIFTLISLSILFSLILFAVLFLSIYKFFTQDLLIISVASIGITIVPFSINDILRGLKPTVSFN